MVRVFAPLAMIILAIEVKLGHMNDIMWETTIMSIVLLCVFILSWAIIDEYKKHENP